MVSYNHIIRKNLRLQRAANSQRLQDLGYVGESDAGLVELSKGCPKLRKLRMV
ncbi:hypothetical protein Tco_1060552, partial [Tanacetum coccineum]